MSRILIKNGRIATLGDNNRILENHAILVDDGKISKIAPEKDITETADTVLDATGKLVMPGFINAHMHFYSTLVRGLGKAKPSKNFVEVLENLWWRLDKQLLLDDCYYSTLIPCIDAIKKGTTTIIDHHASPGAIKGSLKTIAKAVKETGLRASLCYELSDRDGEKVAREGIEENVDFLESCKDEKDDQLRALFGLHASFTITDETMKKAVDEAKRLDAGFHIHTAEAASDQEHCEKTHGMRVVERLNSLGILGPKTITAHCVHVNEKEMNLLRETGTNVVHNPQSNINNAVGVAPLLKLSDMGIPVGLGTDAMTVNMLEEMRVALWIHKLANNNPSVGFCEAINTLAFNNAKIANKYWNLGLGELKEGHAADIILIDYHPPTPFDETTFLGHLAFGVSQSAVDTTIASGNILMQNKQLKINVDEAAIAREADSLTRKLWDRF